MSFVEYTESELTRIPKDEDGMQDLVNRNILEIIKAFSEQGHSGLSASYVLSKLERLLQFKPISPLTGADDEWRFIVKTVFAPIRTSVVRVFSKMWMHRVM